MPNGEVPLVTEQACDRTHEALNIEMKNVHQKINSMSSRIWGILIGIAGILGAVLFDIVDK